MPETHIVAVVVTHDRLDMLRRCLAAVAAQSVPTVTLLVVDNASGDGTADFLSYMPAMRAGGGVHVVRLPDNRGGAGGFTAGIRAALDLAATHVWLMDDDCIPAPDALQHLCDALALVAEPAFVGSQIYDVAGECTNVLPVSLRPGGNGYPQFAKWLGRGLLEVEALSFVSVLIPCGLIEQAGLPYADFFIWADDVEYTMRLSRFAKGFVVAASTVTHLKSGDASFRIARETSPARIALYFYYYRNTLFTHRRHFGWWSRKTIGFLLRAAQDARQILGRADERALKMRTLLRGLLHGVRLDLPIIYYRAGDADERNVSHKPTSPPPV